MYADQLLTDSGECDSFEYYNKCFVIFSVFFKIVKDSLSWILQDDVEAVCELQV